MTTACLAACTGARTDVCTAEELGWQEHNICFFGDNADFVSVELQDCGLMNMSPNDRWFCHTTLHFNAGTVAWLEVDYGQSAPYDCDGNTLTIDNDTVSATWDETTGVLTWNDVTFLPMCSDA